MDTTFCKILVVDDEMLVRQGIIHLLDWEGEGFQIAGEASNGREAFELIELQRPHIILTDIVMPVMDGEELIRLVKGMYPEIEVIVLSSFSEFEYVRSTFQSGVADYILKPRLEAASLLAVLKKPRSGFRCFSMWTGEATSGNPRTIFWTNWFQAFQWSTTRKRCGGCSPYRASCC